MHVRFRYAATLLAGAALACSVTVARADDKAVRKQIEAGYKQLIVAMKAKDIDGIMKLGTADFTYKQGKMKMTGEQMKTMMSQQFAQTKSVDKMTMSIDKLTVKGNKAIVMSSGTSTVTIGGADGKDHKMADVSSS